MSASPPMIIHRHCSIWPACWPGGWTRSYKDIRTFSLLLKMFFSVFVGISINKNILDLWKAWGIVFCGVDEHRSKYQEWGWEILGRQDKGHEPLLIPFWERQPPCDIHPLKFFGRIKTPLDNLNMRKKVNKWENCLGKGFLIVLQGWYSRNKSLINGLSAIERWKW